jgi:hypothetical protein
MDGRWQLAPGDVRDRVTALLAHRRSGPPREADPFAAGVGSVALKRNACALARSGDFALRGAAGEGLQVRAQLAELRFEITPSAPSRMQRWRTTGVTKSLNTSTAPPGSLLQRVMSVKPEPSPRSRSTIARSQPPR